jgi:uncharacterized glyoxalase superfamily protein PhnB
LGLAHRTAEADQRFTSLSGIASAGPGVYSRREAESRGASYHLEFTRKAGHKAGTAPTEDNLLVFYLPNENEWQRAIDRLMGHGYTPVKAFNPYWDKRGVTFADPDGYRVVLQQANWPG